MRGMRFKICRNRISLKKTLFGRSRINMIREKIFLSPFLMGFTLLLNHNIYKCNLHVRTIHTLKWKA